VTQVAPEEVQSVGLFGAVTETKEGSVTGPVVGWQYPLPTTFSELAW
jgi:hypothetical protein